MSKQRKKKPARPWQAPASKKPESAWRKKVNEIKPARPPLTVGELRHGDPARYARFDEDVEHAARFLLGYATVLDRIRTAQLPSPAGKSFLWCYDHETDRPHLVADWPGAPQCDQLVLYVHRSDAPGEAAIHPNVARQHEREMAKLLDRFHRDVESLMSMARLYTRRAPNEADRLALDKQNAPAEPGCACCQRVGQWARPFTKQPTTVGGILDEAALLCDWCWHFARRVGRVPTEQESRDHHDPSVTRVEVKVSETESVRLPN